MNKTVVINAVGLTQKLIGEHTPRIREFVSRGKLATVGPVLPAVTCSVQTTYLTGKAPREHGIVGNGWYFRDECEIKFWKQSDKLVQSPRIWDIAKQRDPSFTCANICWWYAMYSSCDYTVTPRPIYFANGRKMADIWTHPPQLRHDLQRSLSRFPLFNFWGPNTDIAATEWIADATIEVDKKHSPTLSLVYLPHLDYDLQKFGPDSRAARTAASELDAEVGKLIDHFQAAKAKIILLSEYGITRVSRPVHLNRVLRKADLLAVRDELERELLDAGESVAFAVADHQVAHIYINDPSRRLEVRALLEATPGVARVLDAPQKAEAGLDHPRSGELIALAEPDAWFTYYYWLDDARAPDFARTVDIHRKPGYDPVELFFDPHTRFMGLKIFSILLRTTLNFRTLFDVIGLDATVVKGSHGIAPQSPAESPVFATNSPDLLAKDHVDATEVCDLILNHL
jgi:predicted AlkP superfamily pyrophosphatase or phosphodiesterase